MTYYLVFLFSGPLMWEHRKKTTLLQPHALRCITHSWHYLLLECCRDFRNFYCMLLFVFLLIYFVRPLRAVSCPCFALVFPGQQSRTKVHWNGTTAYNVFRKPTYLWLMVLRDVSLPVSGYEAYVSFVFSLAYHQKMWLLMMWLHLGWLKFDAIVDVVAGDVGGLCVS